MTWIGLRDADMARFAPLGLGQDVAGDGTDAGVGTGAADPDSVLACGTILCEVRHDRSDTRRNLIRFAARSPWISSLSVCIDPDGSIVLMQAQGDRHLSCRLATDLGDAIDTAIVSFAWDGPGRIGVLSLWVPDRAAFFQTTVPGPIPLSLRDARRIVADDSLCRVDPQVAWLGLSDRIEAAGPPPGLAALAMIDTPQGPRPIHSLRAGQVVRTATGAAAPVIWTGSQEYPARGRFAPILLRAPFHGLHGDLIVAPDQRLRLTGSNVEYLFGLEEVRVAARHLPHDPVARHADPVWTMRYYQILLDRPAVMVVNGAPLESLDAGPLIRSPGSLRWSALAGVRPDLLRDDAEPGVPVLRGFEAFTLTAGQAA